MNIKNIKISQIIILLIVINLISISYKVFSVKLSKLNAYCVASYEIILPNYNQHLDEIIRGNVSDHILRTVSLPKKNYAIVNKNLFQLWEVNEIDRKRENCNELRESIVSHLLNLEKKISDDLKNFRQVIISLDSPDILNLKLAAIIKSKSSFIIIDFENIKFMSRNMKDEVWLEFLSKLIFFNVVYMFVVFVFLAIRKKFSNLKFK